MLFKTADRWYHILINNKPEASTTCFYFTGSNSKNIMLLPTNLVIYNKTTSIYSF